MANIYWTFGGVQMAPISSDREKPEWHRELRSSVENLLGTGLAEFNLFGFGEWKLTMEVNIESESEYLALKNMQGVITTLANDEESWSNVLMTSEQLRPVRGGWEGTVEFARSSGA